MSKLVDRTGQRYGRLVVLSRHGSRQNKAEWLCACDCGRQTLVLSNALHSGNTRSCGCLQPESVASRNSTHGLSRVEAGTYKVWKDMKARCYVESNKHFKDYGGRGIEVCERWRNDFAAFLADMGARPQDMTIDRRDGDGHYEPSNCRWADKFTQARNRRNNHVIEYLGESKTLAQWCSEFGLESSLVRYRLRRGWALSEAFRKFDGRTGSRNSEGLPAPIGEA